MTVFNLKTIASNKIVDSKQPCIYLSEEDVINGSNEWLSDCLTAITMIVYTAITTIMGKIANMMISYAEPIEDIGHTYIHK